MSHELLWMVYESLKVHFREDMRVSRENFTGADAQAMARCAAEDSGFDAQEMKNKVFSESTERYHYKLGNSDLLVAGGEPSDRLLLVMAKVLGAMGTESHYTIQWFMSDASRKFPPRGEKVKPVNINGGYCMPCDPGTIVIYRREDALRVLIHELFHASCLDDHTQHIAQIEAETEAWAEIIYAMVGAVEQGMRPEWAWRIQSGWAAAQNRRLDRYGVRGPSDYAWRYTLGKEEVWTKMGLPVHVSVGGRPSNSLRLGAPQLDIS